MRHNQKLAVLLALALGLLVCGIADAKPGKNNPPKSSSGSKSGGGAVPSTATPVSESNATPLPDSVARTIKETFPGSVVGSHANINDNGLALYSVEIRIGAVLKTVDIAIDTTIAKVATLVPTGEAPEAVSNAIHDADEKAMITRIMKVEVRSEVKTDGDKPRLVDLEKPKYYYLGKLFKEGKPGHITLAEDGKVLTPLAWEGKPADTSSTDTTPKKTSPSKKSK